MAEPEWFRRTTWSPEDHAEFQERLGRSRSTFKKAQYLRIQALHLAEIGTPHLLEAAITLLDQLITHFPDPFELARAHQQRARCLSDLGRHQEAIEAYEAAVIAQRACPNVQSGIPVDYADLVVGLHRTDLYARVESLLDEFPFSPGPQFPAGEYSHAVVRAFLAAERKDQAAARAYAEKALAAAAKTEAPFRFHRKLGLVSFVDPEVLAKLRAWCAA
jgi:tetratricopeptide (TPR) repeat protein